MSHILEEFKKNVQTTMERSQEDFEKQLRFIAAGALGLSMLLIDKVVAKFETAEYKSILIVSWILLGATLVINLVSHILSVSHNYKTLDEIENNRYLPSKITGRNHHLNILNITSIITLLIGITFLIIFNSLNI